MDEKTSREKLHNNGTEKFFATKRLFLFFITLKRFNFCNLNGVLKGERDFCINSITYILYEMVG